MPTTPKPQLPRDLALAPVAVSIDRNLAPLRELPADRISYELELQTDSAPYLDDREERRVRFMRLAVRDIDLHGWDADLTEDGTAVRLSGGSVTLDLAVGPGPYEYLTDPEAAART